MDVDPELQASQVQDGEGPTTEILVIELDTTRGTRAEGAERESQRVLQQAMQVANVGLWDVDLLSSRVHYSHEWKQQLGYEDNEIGDSLEEWASRLHPDDGVRAHDLALAYLAAPGPSYEQEFRLRHKDGSYRWILARGTVYSDADGKPSHALGVHIDITDKKQAEEALRASEQQQRALAEALAAERDRLAAVLECLPVGVWIAAPDGRGVAKNRQADLIWHGDAPLSASVEEYKEYAAWDAVTGEPLALEDYPVARVLRTGEPQAPWELRIRRFDGSEGIVLVSAVPLRDRDGNSAGVVGVNVDITERKQAEDALRASEAALQRSQAVAHVGHWQWNLAAARPGGSSEWSAELQRILGIDFSAVEDDPAQVLQRIIHPDDRMRVWEQRSSLERDPTPTQTEFRVVRPDGSVRYMWAAYDEAICDGAGNVVRRSGVVQDITERKLREIEREQMQEQMQRQAQMAAIGQLAAGIAHDFNNIMSVISIYAEMTSEAPGLTDKERERSQTIVDQAQRATRLIRQILDFSRRAVYERQVLDLLPLLKEAAKLLRQTLPENIEVKLDAAPGEYFVLADPTRMQQMAMNLALNARDAMPDGGVLHVGLDKTLVKPGQSASVAGPAPLFGPGAWVQVMVSDTGAGIRPEHLAHIFEPFFTTKEPGKGTGLGLAQVQGIVAQHEGHIAVASELAAGTIFTIYLPAVVMQTPPEETPLKLGLPQGHGECVLLVEDDAAVRGSLAVLLEGWNYKVVQAANGQEALACLARPWQQVDVILSDVVMPRLGGVGLVKALRKEGATTPVILMSGYMASEAHTGLKEAGVLAWLDKPPSSAALANALARAIGAGS